MYRSVRISCGRFIRVAWKTTNDKINSPKYNGKNNIYMEAKENLVAQMQTFLLHNNIGKFRTKRAKNIYFILTYKIYK